MSGDNGMSWFDAFLNAAVVTFSVGWMFFGEAPFSKLFPGVLFILAGGFLVILHDRKN